MIDEAQHQRIEAMRSRKDKVHARIKESSAMPGYYSLILNHFYCSEETVDFFNSLLSRYYQSPGEAARAWHYQEERNEPQNIQNQQPYENATFAASQQ